MLKDELVQKLQKINSFGYKVIKIQELNLIKKYYTCLHGLKMDLRLQNMHFFGSWQTMYMYLVLGLTKKQDIIILSNQIPPKIQNCIKSLQRKTIRINLAELSTKQFHNSKEKYNLLLLSNPDLMTGLCTSKHFITKVIENCKQKGITVLCDESVSVLCPDQNFYSLMNQDYTKLVVIKKIGTLLKSARLNKYVCFFNSLELKQSINKSPSKGLKILPNDLVIVLIHLEMSESGLKQRQRQITNIKINFQFLLKLLVSFKQKLASGSQCSQYCIMSEGKIQPFVSRYLSQYVPWERLENGYIRIDLNCQPLEFQKGVEGVIQKIPQSKL